VTGKQDKINVVSGRDLSRGHRLKLQIGFGIEQRA
jgi:hypothetical protein